MNISCIILSNTKNIELYGICQRAIRTLIWSEPDIKFNIVVIESNKEAQQQGFFYGDDITTIIPNENFNYNQFLNYGLDELRKTNKMTEWVLILNNDLIFTQHWLSKLLDWQKEHPSFLSLNPWEPKWHETHGLTRNIDAHYGYRVPYEITGWCLIINKQIIEKCELFDPRFIFWYQDNDYARTIEKFGFKHALVTQSRVYHMTSQSHNILTEEEKQQMLFAQRAVYLNKWENL